METVATRQLKLLGLTRQEIAIYTVLSRSGSMTVKEIGKKIGIFPNTAYRTLRKLENINFVEKIKISPISYQALPQALCITAMAKKKTEVLRKLAQEIILPLDTNSSPMPTKIELIHGKDRIFDLGAKMLANTKKEMLVISIGEELPPNLLLAVIKAKQRGVAIRMIAHKNDMANKDILANLKRNGYEIRHYSDWGFHLAIYDGKKALIIVNDPQDTEQRVAMYIQNSGLANALKDYFYSIWSKASVV